MTTEAPTQESILKATSRHFGIPITLLRNADNRTQDVAYARHLAMYLSRKLTFTSYKKIGDFYGFKHTTVLYACKQVEKAMYQTSTKGDIAAITSKLSQFQ